MTSDRCIVIGASAGGVETLVEVIEKLPADLPAAVCVVLHIPPFVESVLPHILARAGKLPAIHPTDGTQIINGTIYVAPPDHHLLIEKNRLIVKKGPKESRFRPSVDALFRSAAYSFGKGAIGVVLSGELDDGTSGLWSIKRMGGVAIIQQPNDARFESMPQSALKYVDADYTLPAIEIGPLLGRLARESIRTASAVDESLKAQLEMETQIAAEGGAFQKGIMQVGQLTPFTCPECHGALVRIQEGNFLRFRCHTGHAYTDSALLEAVQQFTGTMLWQVIRSFEESTMLLTDMANRLEKEGEPDRANIFRAKSKDLEKRSKTFHETVLEHESLSRENLAPPNHT